MQLGFAEVRRAIVPKLPPHLYHKMTRNGIRAMLAPKRDLDLPRMLSKLDNLYV